MKSLPPVLKRNQKAKFICGSRTTYPDQRLWDSCFHAIIAGRYDVDAAKRELTSLMKGQWNDGMLPHLRFEKSKPSVWNTGRPTSGITHPPILATALRKVFKRSSDLVFLQEIYPKVVRYHDWFHSIRSSSRTGLLSIVHPSESVFESSPAYDAIRKRLGKKVRGLATSFKKLDWDQRRIVKSSPFLVEDLLVNCVWIRANEDLAILGHALNLPRDEARFQGYATEGKKAINHYCWNEEARFYFARDAKIGVQIPIKTAAALLTLYAGVPEGDRAKAIVSQIASKEVFWSPWGVTSVGMDSPFFDPKNSSRGPVWIHIQWFVVQGLRRYGYPVLALQLRNKVKDLIAKSGFHEYYNPMTGKGLGASSFSTSALAEVL